MESGRGLRSVPWSCRHRWVRSVRECALLRRAGQYRLVRPLYQMSCVGRALQLLAYSVFLPVRLRLRWAYAVLEQVLRRESQSLNGLAKPGPFLFEKLLPLAFEQQLARTFSDEHAQSTPFFDQFLIHQFLI